MPDFDFNSFPEAPAPDATPAPAAEPTARRGQPDPAWLSYIDKKGENDPNGVRPALVKGLIQTESAWDPAAEYHGPANSHAVGLGQFQPGTADELGIADRRDPYQNIDGIYKYMGSLLHQHGGDEDAALRAYGEPTDEYVSKVQTRAAAWESSAPSVQTADAVTATRGAAFDFNKFPEMSAPPPDDNSAFNSWRVGQLGIDPAKAEASWAIAQQRQLDPTWVSQNFDAMKASQDTDERSAILAAHPALAKIFNDPVTGSIVKDSLPQVASLDSLVSGRSAITHNPFVPDWLDNIGKAIWKGADPEQPYLAAKAMLGRASDEDYARLNQLEQEPSDFGATNDFERAVYGAAGAVPFMGELALLGLGASALGAPLAAASIIGGVGAGGITFLQSVGPTYRRLRAAGADDESAFNWAVGSSVVGGVIMGAAAPGALGIKSLIGTGAKDATESVLTDLTRRGAAWTFAKGLGGHWLTGTGMMTAQAAAESVAEQMAKPGEFDGHKVLEDTKTAAWNAATSMALLAPWGPAADYARDRGRIARTVEDSARIGQLVDAVKTSKVSDPQIERVIAELRQSGVNINPGDDASTIYVDRQAFDRVAAQNEVEPRILASRVLGDGGAAYDTAVHSGSSLPIPIEKYAANMVRSGFHDQLRADVKFTPDGWTQNEALARKGEFDAYVAKSAPLAAEVASVRERELHKALGAGVSVQQAEAHADLMQAIVIRHAIRTGLSPEAAYTALGADRLAIVGKGGLREPLANIETPLPAPGEPRGPLVETLAERQARPEAKARKNPYMPPLVEDWKQHTETDENAQTVETRPLTQEQVGGPLADASKAMAGPKGDLGLGPDESNAALEKIQKEAGPIGGRAPGYGNEATIKTPQKANGEPSRYRVVEADKLVQSHNPQSFGVNPEYPPGVQERDYLATEGEQGKVVKGGARLDNALVLTDTPSAADGPPIVTEGERPVVLGGNGRTMMIKRAFEDEAQRDSYKSALKSKASQFGLDAGEIDKMKNPVLVREATGLSSASSTDDLRAAGRRYNEPLTQALSPRARGLAEAKALRPQTINDLANVLASNGDQSLRELMKSQPQAILSILRKDGVLNEQNAAQFQHGGEITPEAKDRIETMFLGHILDNEQRFSATAPSVLAKIERIAPALMRVAGINPALDEIPRVRAGLDLLNEAKASGHTIDQFVAQGSMFGPRPTPDAVAMAHMLEGRTQRDLASTFNAWSKYAAVDPRQPAMFFEAPDLAKARSMLRHQSIDLDGSTQRLMQPEANPPAYQYTPEFKRWFGESKVVDENGKPLVVYAGLPRGLDEIPESTRNELPFGHAFFSDDREVGAKYAGSHPSERSGAHDFSTGRKGRTYRVFLKMEHPWDMDSEDVTLDEWKAAIDPESHEYRRAERTIEMPSVESEYGQLSFNRLVKLSEVLYRENIAGQGYTLEYALKNSIDGRLALLFPEAAKSIAEKHGFDGLVFGDSEMGGKTYVPFSAEQIKSATGNSGAFDPESRNILKQPAYHGTPHDVDQFKMEKIGTGEGAQVYGHGLYFAENKEIADWYRSKLSSHLEPEVTIRGHSDASAMNGDHGETGAEQSAAALVSRMAYAGMDAKASLTEAVRVARSEVEEMEREIERDRDNLSRGDMHVVPKAQAERRLAANENDLPDLRAREAEVLKFKPEDIKVNHPGRLYQVDVPESDRLLDHDKDFSQQSKTVQGALRSSPIFDSLNSYLEDHGQPEVDDLNGKQIYQALTRLASEEPLFDYPGSDADKYEGDQDKNRAEASEFLRRIGIPGLQYLDAGSRNRGDGNHNFVIWDENEIRNLQRLKQEGVTPEQSAQIERGHLAIIGGPGDKRYEIHLGPGADASTLAHETMHWLVDTLSDAVSRPGADPELVRDHAALLKWAGYEGARDSKNLNVPAEEKIASAWEQYLAEGKAPTIALDSVFGRFAKWMAKIYSGVQGIAQTYSRTNGGSELGMNDEIRGIFDRLLATSDDIEQDKASRAESAGGGGGESPPGDGNGAQPPSGGSGGDGGAGPPREPPRRKPVSEQSLRWAMGVLAKQPISQISDKFYLDAERKNSRRAIDFAAEGKHDESRNADVTRSFAAALHDAAKIILKSTQAQLGKLRALSSQDALGKVAKSAAEGMGHEYLDTMQSLLEGAGLRQPGPDAAQRQTDVPALLARLDFDGRDPNFDPDQLRKFLEKPKPWNTLTPEDAANLTDAAMQIKTAANGASKVILGTRRAERRATIDAMSEFAAKRPDLGLEPITRSADEGLVRGVLKYVGLYNADNLKPEAIWAKFGPEGRALFEATLGGRNEVAKMKGDVLRYFIENFKPMFDGGRFQKLMREDVSPETLRDLNVHNGVMLDGSKMNKETLAMAFLNMGTTGPTGSDARLLGGYKWNEGKLLAGIGRDLPKEFTDFLQGVLDYSEKHIKPLIWEHAERLNGVAPPELQRRKILIRHADGTATNYDGGYFAAKYNSDASSFARQRVGTDSADGSLDQTARATVASSFTKARVNGYKDVVDLNWSNYPNHLNSVFHYLGYDDPVRSLASVLRDRAFREMATRRIGTAQLKQLDDSVKTIASGQSAAAANMNIVSKLLSGAMRSRPISNAIGFSFGIAAQQIPSHTEYAVLSGKISAKNGNLALGRVWSSENWQQHSDLSRQYGTNGGELAYRADHYASLFREALSGQPDVLGGWKRKADTAAFGMMDYADRTLSHVIWDAAFRDALEGRPLADGSIAGNEAAAVEHAERTVRDLMPVHNRLEMAKIVRDPGVLGALQLFRGLKNVVWNTEADLIDKARVANVGSPLVGAVGRYGVRAGQIAASAAVLHLLGKLWGGHGKNDDDGEGLEGWATWAERNAMASLFSLNAPFGGEIAEGIADHLAHGETVAQSLKAGAKELRLSPGTAMIADSAKRLGMMVDSDAETPERVGAATQLLLSNLGGYSQQVGKTGGYVSGLASGNEQPRGGLAGALDVASGITYGSPGEKNTKTIPTLIGDVISGHE